jgi:hypothetical protein
MVDISFNLVRKSNPTLNYDNIEEIFSLKLSKCNILRIDNLDLFSHIKDLDLSGNLITKIENLMCFKSLNYLDLSSNHIDSAGLISSLNEIPKSLKSINLSSNPCILDEASLCILQDRYPELGIIIDIVRMDENNEDNSEEDSNGENEVSVSKHRTIDLSKPLNSEEVLKEIVSRKCKLQSLSTFNLDATILVLK